MDIKILSNRSEIINRAAEMLAERIKSKPDIVLGLSTGATTLSICEALALMAREENLSLRDVKIFYAGEYVGLSQKPYYFERLQEDFFSKTDLQEKNIYTIDGNAADLKKECLDYEQKIELCGGMNLFVGSLGESGGLAFNEPGSSLSSRTRLKTLGDDTIRADARFFGGDVNLVPSRVLTMGIGTICSAEEVLMVVYGVNKAFAVKACLENAISEMCPASVLQMHRNTVFLIDKVAGRLLTASLV